MRIPIILSSAAVLAACAAIEPRAFGGPNARPAYSMACSGMGRTLHACYTKAGELCPKGYAVVDRTSNVIAVPSGGSIIAAPQHTLAIECK